jgi:membrane-bound lytic murein transglycosylase F
MFKSANYPVQFLVLFLIQLFSLFSNFSGLNDPLEATPVKAVHTVKTKSVTRRSRRRSPLKDKKLVVLLDNSMYSHSIYKGNPMGLEYELLNLFAKDKGIELEVKIINEAANLIDSLHAGIGDIAAGSFNVTPERLQKVDFTHPIFETNHHLVHRQNMAIHTPEDLKDKIVMIRKNSIFHATLENYAKQHHIKLNIQEAANTVTDEKLIEMVATKKIDFTVTDGNVARTVSVFYDNIDYSLTLTEKQPVCLAAYKQSEGILETFNQWLVKHRNTLDYALIVKKYKDFSSARKESLRKNFKLAQTGHISQYDDLIKKNAEEIHWDWKLIAAQVFQESKFDPTAKSWVGATGLMQLMPETAKGLGVQKYQLTSPERNIQAGIKYLQWLEKSWKPYVHDKEELIKFVLASYNVGMGHVWDARRLAEKHHLDTQKWDDNVEKMLLKIAKPEYYKDSVVKYGYCRGQEPVTYVKNIFNQYQSYKNFIKN